MLTIRQLRYALAVWREGSFVEAAEKLHVSQPAISGQVRQLELEIGFELFRRTGHGVEVTEVGRAFLVEAEQVHAGILRLQDTARELQGGPAGSLPIGVSSGVALFLMPEVMQATRDASPRVRVEVTTSTTRRINRLLLQERLEIGITVETSPRFLPRELIAEPIFGDTMVLIVPKGHPLDGRCAVNLDELVEESLIMNELSIGYGEIVWSMFDDQGLRPNIAALSDNVETIKAMVRGGGGVALVPRRSVEHDPLQGMLSILKVRPRRQIDIMLVRRQQKMSPITAAYFTAIRDHFRRIWPDPG